jgi:hypothetical protein
MLNPTGGYMPNDQKPTGSSLGIDLIARCMARYRRSYLRPITGQAAAEFAEFDAAMERVATEGPSMELYWLVAPLAVKAMHRYRARIAQQMKSAETYRKYPFLFPHRRKD